MKIHHLNCATMCPFGERLVNGTGSLLGFGRLVCHCLLIESDDGLILVDTGLGLDDVRDMERRFPLWFRLACNPRRDPEETAARQVERLGFSRADVRHIVPTHLDLDHAGGFPDFPQAAVHVFGSELDAAMARSTLGERGRYRPVHWAHGPRWDRHDLGGDKWLGFDAVQALPGAGDEVLLVPLVGHTRGHCGVAVKADGGWLLHAGDAYFFHEEMDPITPRCSPGLALFQRIVAVDDAARRRNQRRLRELKRDHGSSVQIFCAHSPVDLERAQAAAGGPGETVRHL